MATQETETISTIQEISKSKIIVNDSGDQTTVRIPPKGIKGSALVTIIVIAIWMFTILIWTVLLGMMKPLNMVYSVPFWAIGVWTLVKALKMIRLRQDVVITRDKVI